MKNIYVKRALSIMLTGIMTISAVGCGNKNADSSTEATEMNHDIKDYVYSEMDVDFGEGVDYSGFNYTGKFADKLFAAGTVYDDKGMSTVVYTFDQDGSNVQSIKLDGDENQSISSIDITDDGSIYTIESVYGSFEGASDEIDLNDLLGDDVEIIDGDEVEAEAEAESSTESEAGDDTATEEEPETEAETTAEDSEEEPAEPDVPEVPGEEDDTEELEAAAESDSEETVEVEAADGTETSEEVTMDDSIDISSDSAYSGDSYYIIKRDSSGSEVWRTELKYSEEDGTYFYVASFLAVEDKGVLLSDMTGIHLYSFDDGSLVKDIDTSEYVDPSSGIAFSVYMTEEKGLVASLIPEDETLFYTIDADAGTITPIEEGTLPGYEYTLYSGVGYDFIMNNSDAVYGYSIGDAEPTMLMNFVDSDINTYGIYQITAINDKSFLCIMPNEESYTISIMTKVDPSDVKDKKTITLGCNYIDYDVRSQVVKFNKENENYRISILDYSSYDTEEDWTGGATKLNTDIVSGNIPDILVLDTDMPVDSYIAKGLFEDMTDYFANDEELSKNKYFESAMEAFKTDGKMYKIIPSFYVETVATATSNVGDAQTWTIDDLEKIVEEKGIEYKNIFGPLSRDDVFEMALSLSGSQFIDWADLKCSYDSESFIHLLELINEFPEELEEDEYYADTSSYWREGKSIASRFYFSGFSDFNYEEQGQYGEPITLVGFPSDNGTGAAIYPNLQLSMSASSSVKDGCWEFMRYFLSEEYQKTIDSAWPVSQTQIDAMAETAKKKPTYTDENGKEVEYDDTWYIGDTEIVIEPMTDESIERVLGYLGNVSQIGNYNDSINEIIREEAAAYFSGQKSAEEVADIIQSRVQIYVNEIS